jgi:hypothetical protein
MMAHSEEIVPIDAKQAAQSARKYLSDMLTGTPFNLTIEEIERSSDKKHWNITLSYFENAFLSTKTYKLFTVDASDGEVLAMKIAKRP